MSLSLDQVKLKSAARLSGLHPVVAAATAALIERCYTAGVPILITQGLRTSAEQDALYAQGRTIPGAIVTNARGGYSYHNYGLAVDFALLLPGGAASWDMKRDADGDGTADWQEIARQAKALGFEWGGDWSSFKDYPHLQMSFGLTISELRGGAKPSQAQVAAAYAVINKYMEEADELSQAEKQELATLRLEVKELAGAVATLINSKNVLKQTLTEQGQSIIKLTTRVAKLEGKAAMAEVPEWAEGAVEAAVAAGLLDTPEGSSFDFYRTLAVLQRAGLLITIHEGG